jgi:diguanylate cyclase (GGDEF)-like protein
LEYGALAPCCRSRGVPVAPPPHQPDPAPAVQRTRSPVPPRALAISFGALLVPLYASFEPPQPAGEYDVLLWLLALVPAFVLAYHRGWKGAALALTVGMLVLVATQIAVGLTGRRIENWPLFLMVVAAYIGISLGIGWVTELLHRERSEAERLALEDELTALPNRRKAREMLDREFAAARRGRALSVALFDLDAFKGYNDRHGHRAGDEWLRSVAEVFRAATRGMNLSSRYGGEEFLAVLSDTREAGARVFAERVLAGVRTASPAADPQTVSAGIAEYRDGMASPDDLLDAADRALYSAKAAGGDRVHADGDAAPAGGPTG